MLEIINTCSCAEGTDTAAQFERVDLEGTGGF
jgi:hypothetical protein